MWEADIVRMGLPAQQLGKTLTPPARTPTGNGAVRRKLHDGRAFSLPRGSYVLDVFACKWRNSWAIRCVFSGVRMIVIRWAFYVTRIWRLARLLRLIFPPTRLSSRTECAANHVSHFARSAGGVAVLSKRRAAGEQQRLVARCDWSRLTMDNLVRIVCDTVVRA